MNIGILQTDPVYPELRARFGTYPQMFRALFERIRFEPAPRFTTFDVQNGEYPSSRDACDAYLITGSQASANDGDEWIRRLERFIRECHDARKPLVGICFGHQLIASALGGKVERARQGWGVGIHRHAIVARAPFMVPALEELRLIVSHQDQVTVLPDGAELLAASDFCPVAMYRIGHHIYAQQSHPEFVRDYAQGLLDRRREALGEAHYRSAVESLAQRTNEETVARWMLNFLASAIDRGRAP